MLSLRMRARARARPATVAPSAAVPIIALALGLSLAGCVTEQVGPRLRDPVPPAPVPAPAPPPAATPEQAKAMEEALKPSPVTVRTDKPAPPGPVPTPGQRLEALDVGVDDAAMNAATARARETLEGFLATAAAPPAGTSQFRMKVELRDGYGVENLWVMPFSRNAGQADVFDGVVANRPAVVRSVMLGERIRFQREQVTDWGYLQQGRQVGSFTVCVLIARMPPDEAAYYRQQGFDCAPG